MFIICFKMLIDKLVFKCVLNRFYKSKEHDIKEHKSEIDKKNYLVHL